MHSNRRRLAAALLTAPLIALTLACPAPPLRSADPGADPGAPVAAADTAALLLRARLTAPGSADLLSAELVRRFYSGRSYAPAWSRGAGVEPQAEALARALRGAGAEGLRSRDYRTAQIEAMLAQLPAPPHGRLAPSERAELDLLLSDAFLTYARHLANGRIDPKRIHSGWSLEARGMDPVAALERALARGGMEAALAALPPSSPEYGQLRLALQRYRGIQASGGWPALAPGATLRPGDEGDAVAALRARLAAEFPLEGSDSPSLYDPALEAAVRAFQQAHGLSEDGVVGPAMRRALDVDAARRVEQIELSMERLRWLPDDLGLRYIRVNVPAFELEVVEEGRSVLAMRVVGGRPDWRTPIFSAQMSSVVLSPYWNIPKSIVEAEVLPRARRDPDYLRRNGIHRLKDGAGERLRQDPGPLNPLGGVKFLFPNPYNTYLHDTPSRHLFAEPVRAYSHGCMRVEMPLELAEYLLMEQGWSREAIRAGMAAGVERGITLERPLPVHVLYQTAWVDAEGRMQFRDDLYGHDRRLAEALNGKPGTAGEVVSGECITASIP